MKTEKLTILFPWQERVTYKQLSDEAVHDLGIEELCNEAGTTPQERRILLRTLSNLTRDVNVANFRSAVFADLLNHK